MLNGCQGCNENAVYNYKRTETIVVSALVMRPMPKFVVVLPNDRAIVLYSQFLYMDNFVDKKYKSGSGTSLEQRQG
jgi:hypothetical protein